VDTNLKFEARILDTCNKNKVIQTRKFELMMEGPAGDMGFGFMSHPQEKQK